MDDLLGNPPTPPTKPPLFTQAEQLRIVEESKQIFIASITLTKRALERGASEEALHLAQISQIFGITLLGVPPQGGKSNV